MESSEPRAESGVVYRAEGDIDWEEAPLKRWLSTITRRSTMYNYRGSFRVYHEYTGMTATELIDEALEDAAKDPREKKDIVLNRLIGFYNWLKTEYGAKSRGRGEHVVLRKGISDKLAHMRVASIRSFYATFGIVVRMRGRTSLPRPKVRNKRMRVGAEQVKRLVDHARTPRDRAIILTLFQGGMDASTLCGIRYGDVASGLEGEEHPLRLDLYRPKTGVEYYTFLGKNAVEALKAYVADAEMRDIKLTHDMHLFIKERGKQPLSEHNVQTMLRAVAIKSGLVDEDMNGKAFNPLGPHALRESFGSIMINSGVPDTIVDFWLGHSIGEMGEAYKGVQFDSLRQMYLDREKLLSVSQPPVDLEEVEKKVRVEIEERNRQLQTLVNGLTAKNLGLEAEIKELKAKTEKMGLDLKKEITEKEGQIEKMEHDITDVVRDIEELKKLVAKSMS